MKTEILTDLFKSTSINQFNIAIECYNIQGLYERRKIDLAHKYFDGNMLKYSIYMSDMFNSFQNKDQEKRSKELRDKMYFLLKEIKSKKKYSQPHSKEVKEYNLMVLESNELNKGILELTKIFKSIKRNYSKK